MRAGDERSPSSKQLARHVPDNGKYANRQESYQNKHGVTKTKGLVCLHLEELLLLCVVIPSAICCDSGFGAIVLVGSVEKRM